MPLLRFTPRQLEAFASVAQAGGFGAAAERLGLSPSAISQLVAELEDAVGFRLFDRSSRKVALSAAGREFLAPAQAALAQLVLAERAAADVRHRAVGRVRVAAPLAIAATLVPAALEAFARTHPQVDVRLRDTPVEQLVDAVVQADADLAVGPDRSTTDDIACAPLFESPWVLWCAPGHALAAFDPVSWPMLRQHAVVTAGRDHERGVGPMDPRLPEGERIVPVDVVDHLTTAFGLAARGLVATLAPAYVAGLARPLGLVMRRITGPEVLRQVCRSPAAEAFAEHLAAWLVSAAPELTPFAAPRGGAATLGAARRAAQATGSTTLAWPVPDATK
jgi:DNA-binding transcriptional LysR family regulator